MSEQDKIKSYQAGRLSGKGEHAIAKLADEQKDQVRQQIESDVKAAYSYMSPGPRSHAIFGGIDSATAQDKIAWNRCLDEVRILLMMSDKSFASAEDYKSIVNEIEKLRR